MLLYSCLRKTEKIGNIAEQRPVYFIVAGFFYIKKAVNILQLNLSLYKPFYKSSKSTKHFYLFLFGLKNYCFFFYASHHVSKHKNFQNLASFKKRWP
jgi:hypothetical protein